VDHGEAARPRAVRGTPLAALFGGAVALFLPTLLLYPDVWRAQPYTHGYLIAAASVWLVWRERDVLREPAYSWAPAILLAAVLSLVWLVATISDTGMVAQASFPVLLLLWVTGVYGREAGKRLAPVAATFFLAVPVWGVLTRPLQSLTVVASGAVVDLLRVPAVVEGDVVHITYGSFIIASGCAGLNYLMSGLTIGALYAQIVPRLWRARAAVVALAGLLAMAGNWIRVSSLIAIGHGTRMESVFITQPGPHLFFGWTVFLATLLIFFPLAGLIVRRGERRVTTGPEAARTASEPMGAVATGLAQAPGPSLQAALWATAALTLGPLLYYSVGALPARAAPAPEISPPGPLWNARGETLSRPYPWVPAFWGADEHVAAEWTDGSDAVLVDRLTYREQAQGAELIGYNSQIAPDSLLAAERVVVTPGPQRRFVNEAIVLDTSAPVLVWYWYSVGGLETESPVRAKLLEIVAFVRRKSVSEVLAVSTACEPTTCSRAAEVLADFLGGT
jgi:exosortase